MKKWGILLVALLALFAALPTAVRAQAQGADHVFSLSPQYPSIVGKADTTFTFNVDVNYTGSDTRTVNLTVQGPQGWDLSILGGIPDTPIASMRLQPFQTYSNTIKVQAVPPTTPLVDPGSYAITVEAKEPPPGTLDSKVPSGRRWFWLCQARFSDLGLWRRIPAQTPIIPALPRRNLAGASP